MSFSTDVRDQGSLLGRDILRTLGETWTYSNRGGVGISVYVEPGQDSRELADALGCDIEETARQIFIPRHTSPTFPPTAGIAIDDTLTQPTTNYVYFIKRWVTDPTGAGYLLDTVRYQVRNIGV